MNEHQRNRARMWGAAQSDADLLAVLQENSRLRAEAADLRRELAKARGDHEARNIEAAIERGKRIRNHRPRDIRGLLALAREAINGRTS